jgi:ribosomal protein L13E
VVVVKLSSDSQMSTAEQDPTSSKTKLTHAIYALHANLPRLELSLSEIGELKEKVLKKERELEEAIAENKAALEEVYARSQENLNESDVKGSPADVLEPEDDDATERVRRERKDLETETETETKIYYRGESESAIALLMRAGAAMDEATVADLIIKSSSDDLTKRQAATKEALRVSRLAQDRLRVEIGEDERVLEELQREVEERRQKSRDCEAEKVALSERAVALETELTDLAKKFCELNEQLTGSSEEESHAILQSIRGNAQSSSSAPRSPLLQKYAVAVNESEQNVAHISRLSLQLIELNLEDDDLCRQVEEVKGRLEPNRESASLMAAREEKLLGEMKACEAEASVLQTTGRDLIVAMRWGKWASRGLCQPSASTAPLMLLLFEQYCRQQVPFKRLDASEMKGVTYLRERLMAGLDVAEYVASAARDVGYRAGELRSGGYSAKEIYGVGFSLQEMKESGICARDLQTLGVTIGQLKDGGYTARELRNVRYIARELREAGYTARELIRGGYSLREIQQEGYTIREIHLISADFKTLGVTMFALRQAGYTAQELRSCWEIPPICPVPSLQSSGTSTVNAFD